MKRMMLMVLLAAGCQAPMQSGSQCVVTPGYVAGIEYFQWKSDPAVDLIDQTGYVGPIAVQALEEAVTSELVGKGFREAAATADENTMLPILVAAGIGEPGLRAQGVHVGAGRFPEGRIRGAEEGQGGHAHGAGGHRLRLWNERTGGIKAHSSSALRIGSGAPRST